MKITTKQALAALAADKTAAAQFDAASKVDYPGKTRPEVVELTLQALNAKRDKTATLERLKRESALLKSKLAELKKITAKAQATHSSNKLTGASYAVLAQAATHRSSPPEQKAAARGELAALLGVSITDSGIVSHSQRGGRAVKLSKSNQ